MEMLFSKWNILFWPFYLLGWKPWLNNGDDGYGYIDIPEGLYRLTVMPRLGHNAKEVTKQMTKVFNDKMDLPDGFDSTREYLQLKVCEFFELKEEETGDAVSLYDVFARRDHHHCVDHFSFQVDPEEREKALKQLKGCNALKVIFDEVKEMQKDAELAAKWRYQDQYEEEALKRIRSEETGDFDETEGAY